MKLVLTLLVRDEEDIIDTHMAYHLAQGVDFIIVTDNRSKDDTTDIIRRYQDAGVAQLIVESDDDYAQAKWVTRMARLAYAKYRADWVINSDADEFWWPRSGNLKTILADLPPETGILDAQRSDFAPTPEDGRPFYERMVFRETQSFNALGNPLGPKICHRAHPEITVAQGNHSVEGGNLSRFERTSPLEIFHFPLRTYAQFENKIVNGGRSYRQNTELHPSIGDAWRHLYRLYELSGLQDFYTKRLLSSNEIKERVKNGSLVIDSRLRRYISSLR